MYSGATKGAFNILRDLVLSAGGARQARQLLQNVRQILPAAEMTGVRGIAEPVRRAAVKAGLVDEVTAFPSVVSQQGGNLGTLGTRAVPTAKQLGQAPKPQFGPGSGVPTPPAGARTVNTLVPQPLQGPRPRGGELAPTTQAAPLTPTVRTQFTEDLISPAPVQGPGRAPMQGPAEGEAIQGTLDLRFPAGARSATEFTTARGAIRPEGTNIAGQPYRGAPVATERNLETLRLNRPQEDLSRVTAAPEGQQSIFTSKLPDIFSGEYNIRPELLRQLPKEVQDRIGTVMMREAADLGPVAPRPAFGTGAGPAPVDDLVTAAFARNAAPGAELVDLGALMNNPAFRAAVGGAGVGLFAGGLAAMRATPGDQIGGTTAGAPPELPLPPSVNTPLFTETDGTPLGAAAPVVAPANPPAMGNIDPTAPAPVATTGSLERGSAVREALAQTSPAAAAVLRATEPMSPERYKSIEDYYAAREAYAGSADKRRELMKYMGGQSSTLGSQLASWAEANPTLAYEYQRRQLVNPAANQQSAEAITTTKATTTMGSEDAANAVGSAEANAAVATNPNQAAVALRDTLRMNNQPYLQRVQNFIQNQAPRAAMYGGY